MAQAEEKTVLVVDDEEDVRFFLQTALENSGFKVETAADGLEALEKAKANPPDCISLDLVMPKKSGAKFLYEIQRIDSLKKVPVIIVTAHARDDLGKKDLQDILASSTISGPETYLEKPVTAETYVNSIKRALSMDVGDADSGKNGDLKKKVEFLLENANQDQLNEVLEMLKKK